MWVRYREKDIKKQVREGVTIRKKTKRKLMIKKK